MKALLTFLAIVGVSIAHSQTLYVPSGTSGIGSSSNAHVGIGTSTPSNAYGHNTVLDVRGAGHSKIATTSNGADYITAMYTDSDWSGNSGGFIGTESNHNLYLMTNHVPRMVLNTSGNVGIGTTAPSNIHGWGRVLDVYSDAHSKIIARSNGSNNIVGLYSHNAWDGTYVGGFVGTETNTPLYLMTNVNVKMAIDTDGNVGIGTMTPSSKLDVRGHVLLEANGNPRIYTGTGSTELNRFLLIVNAPNNASASGVKAGGLLVSDSYAYADPGKNDLIVKGNVGIGTSSPDAKLSVKGQIHAQEVKVDLNGAIAPDYVFEKDYVLPSLEQIQSYITANKHLPEVPSAKEMEEKGINVGEMNLLLLKKVEELTLYQIQLNEAMLKMAEELQTLRRVSQQSHSK
jgi:hypothetical protein